MITGPGSGGRSGNVYAVDAHRRTAVGRNFKFEPTTIIDLAAMVMETVIGYLSSSEQRPRLGDAARPPTLQECDLVVCSWSS